jgi:hypothetical protein
MNERVFGEKLQIVEAGPGVRCEEFEREKVLGTNNESLEYWK